MSDNSDNNGIIDMIDKAVSLYQENKDMVESVVPDTDTLNIDDQSPLREAIVKDDEVIIVTEVMDDGIENIGIGDTEEGIFIEINGQKIEARVPDDISVDDADANLNNGVLEVNFPRVGGDE